MILPLIVCPFRKSNFMLLDVHTGGVGQRLDGFRDFPLARGLNGAIHVEKLMSTRMVVIPEKISKNTMERFLI